MRYGIIGTGWIAEAFIEGARLACGADIAAVYSRTAERGEDFARRNGRQLLVVADEDELIYSR